MDAHGNLNQTRCEDHQHPTSLNCIWELWKNCIQGTEWQSLGHGKKHIIIKGIGKVTKARDKHHQESVLILTSQLRQPPAATCLQPVSSGYWKDGCWEFATRLILLKVIYAPVLYNYSCVFKFVWFFLHWVFKLFVHQRAPLSRNYTKHFYTKATFVTL